MTSDIKQPGERTDVKAETAYPGLPSLTTTFVVFLIVFGMLGWRSLFFFCFAVGVLAMIWVLGRSHIVSLSVGAIVGGGLGCGLSGLLNHCLAPQSYWTRPFIQYLCLNGYLGVILGIIVAAIFVIYGMSNGWAQSDSRVKRDDQIIYLVAISTLFFAIVSKISTLAD